MEQLQRKLGVRDASALVVGTVIGTGVFLKTATMAQEAGSPLFVLVAWILAGLMSFAGALTYAEITCLFPNAGGEYVFLREGYGPLIAFLFGWTRFWIITPGSIAAYSVGAGSFLAAVFPMTNGQQSLASVGLILFFTFINCFAVSVGGGVQSLLTGLKILLIGGLIFGLLFLGEPHGSEAVTGFQGISHFGLAVLAALWAFDGWNNLPMAAGEIKNPGRAIPWALAGGMSLVLGIYLATNYAYFFVLPFHEIVNANSTLHPEGLPVATKAAETLLGSHAIQILSLAFVLSAMGAMNGATLTGARVPYAMAKDGLFFKRFGKLNQRTRVPVSSILIQGLWACPVALSGTFDQITDCVVFSAWVFYGLTAFALFRFRARGLKSEYQTPGYPVVPALFLLSSVLLVCNTIYSLPKQSAVGVLFILAGIPAYWLFVKRNSDRRKDKRE